MQYLKKHWQGALPLSISLWINLILVAILWHFFGALLSGHIYAIRPDKAAFLFLVHLAFQSPITIWQTVGVWRSARKKKESSARGLSALLAQVMAIVIFVINHLNYLTVNYEDDFRMAHLFLGFAQDPYGDFNISKINGRRIILLSGGLGFGASHQLETFLNRNETIQGIVLNSPGGWVYEGRALFQAIRGAGLDTFIFDECNSSCTLAFVAGNRRYASIDARIGLHSFLPVTQSFDVNRAQNEASRLFLGQGVSPQLVGLMFEAPPNRLWYPPLNKLTEAGMIDQLIDCASPTGDVSGLCDHFSMNIH